MVASDAFYLHLNEVIDCARCVELNGIWCIFSAWE